MIKDVVEYEEKYHIKDIFGKNIKNLRYRDLQIKIAYITPKLIGGSMRIEDIEDSDESEDIK